MAHQGIPFLAVTGNGENGIGEEKKEEHKSVASRRSYTLNDTYLSTIH